jgi:hypothetical protein
MVTVVVVIPRDVSRAHVKHARRAGEAAGFRTRRVRGAVAAGCVRLEFITALHREEALVLGAFEIEVDDLLSSCVVVRGGEALNVVFSGRGAHIASV